MPMNTNRKNTQTNAVQQVNSLSVNLCGVESDALTNVAPATIKLLNNWKLITIISIWNKTTEKNES